MSITIIILNLILQILYKIKNQTLLPPSVETRIKEPFYKRILIVDDHPDITLAFKSGLEGYYHDHSYSRISIIVTAE